MLVSVLVLFNLAKSTSHEEVSGLLPLTPFKSCKLSYAPPQNAPTVRAGMFCRT